MNTQTGRTRIILLFLGAAEGLIGAGPCSAQSNPAALAVPYVAAPVRVDGRIEEPCYRTIPPLTNFVVAGQPTARPQPTKAWVFWDRTRMVFAFDVIDREIVAAGASHDERDVDPQDRVEFFLWSGRTNEAYYCVEIAARGAVHDYSARFYRQFDDAWAPLGMKIAVARTANGYQVEAEVPRRALEAAGFALRPGAESRLGLFRADFQPNRPRDPTWICWVDAHGLEPDFHVAGSFGRAVLAGPESSPATK
jgi:hypothetical protein